MKNWKILTVAAAIVAMAFVIAAPSAWAQQAHVDKTHAAIVAADSKPVTWDTFVRAETDKYFNSYVGLGGIGNVYNIRQPTPIDQQKVVRMNRDTLYSIAVFDLTNPGHHHQAGYG